VGCLRKGLIAAAVLALVTGATPARAQMPNYPGIGRTPTAQEIGSWDIAIGPSGQGLPPGGGTAKDGALVYLAKCQICHGPALEGTQYGSRLVGSRATLTTATPARTVGSFWAYATTVWDYINRAMPRAPFKEGSLTANEVYATTAWILFKNGIVQETDRLDAASLPRVRMPNRDGFVPPEPDWTWYRQSCPLGKCGG
jgi:cytochrome c